jgi:hypothetical protein
MRDADRRLCPKQQVYTQTMRRGQNLRFWLTLSACGRSLHAKLDDQPTGSDEHTAWAILSIFSRIAINQRHEEL